MAAGIALELHKVTREMTLFWCWTETDYLTCCSHLIIEYSLNRTLYIQSKSVIITMKSFKKNSEVCPTRYRTGYTAKRVKQFGAGIATEKCRYIQQAKESRNIFYVYLCIFTYIYLCICIYVSVYVYNTYICIILTYERI